MDDADDIQRLRAAAQEAYRARSEFEARIRREVMSWASRIGRATRRARGWFRGKILPVGSLRSDLWVWLRNRRHFEDREGHFEGGAGPQPLPGDDPTEYAHWLALNEDRPGSPAKSPGAGAGPVLSVCVVHDGVNAATLVATLESLLRQTDPRWEVCLVAGGERVVEFYQSLNSRIRVGPSREGTALQAAVDRASARHVTFLDSGDELSPNAVAMIVTALKEYSDLSLLYTDEDRLDEGRTRRRAPFFKPAWSPYRLRSHNYVGRLAVLPLALVRGLKHETEHELLLRVADLAGTVVHLPRVLCHRRCAMNQGALSPTRPRLARRPLVSILIPNRDNATLLRKCLRSVGRSEYENQEVLILENNSREPETLGLYRELEVEPHHRVLPWRDSFNFAAINNCGARRAAGEVLLFLNNDVEAVNPEWLSRMLELIEEPGVGAIGAKLVYADGRIQHAGIVLGINEGYGHRQRLEPGDARGYGDSLRVTREVSAVTGACLMIRREVFERIGGFDERFAVAFNDLDLCLRLRAQGLAVLWTPDAELIHHEGRTRGLDRLWGNRARYRRELRLFRRLWASALGAGDPFDSPHLATADEGIRLRLDGKGSTTASLAARTWGGTIRAGSRVVALAATVLHI